MIRLTIKAKTDLIGGVIDSVEGFEDFAYAVFLETFDEIKPDMMDELQHEPGSPSYKIDWTSNKQMKAFFASDGFGRGIPTRRTGEIKNSWTAETTREGDLFYFTVDNKNPASKFLYGSLAKNRSSALRYQQRFHAKTGWPKATDIVKKYSAKFKERYREKLHELAKTKFRERAFTR